MDGSKYPKQTPAGHMTGHMQSSSAGGARPFGAALAQAGTPPTSQVRGPSNLQDKLQPAVEKLGAAIPLQRPSEGLSALVSYSSSSAEASASEDNALDDPEDSLSDMPEPYKNTLMQGTAATPSSEVEKGIENPQAPVHTDPQSSVIQGHTTDSANVDLDDKQKGIEIVSKPEDLQQMPSEDNSNRSSCSEPITSSITSTSANVKESLPEIAEPKDAMEKKVNLENVPDERLKDQPTEEEPTGLEEMTEVISQQPASSLTEVMQSKPEIDEAIASKASLKTSEDQGAGTESFKEKLDEEIEQLSGVEHMDVDEGTVEIQTNQKPVESNESSESDGDVQEGKQMALLSSENGRDKETKMKQDLDDDSQGVAEEPIIKPGFNEEPAGSSLSSEEKVSETWETTPYTNEAEMKDSLSDELKLQGNKIDHDQKIDEESRDSISLSADQKETQEEETMSDDKDKDDDKDDEFTPSRRRKSKKRAYERPRGEGGKFKKEKPDSSVMDEETRMDSLPQDEDSQGSISRREVRRFRCEVIVPESTEAFTVDKVVEYVWPLEGCGEHYFIQEQISQYLGIMSFKRKYPDLRRRPIDMQEKDYLKEKRLVSEMACDLGLTAVRSEDVLDVMFNDFPSKFEELQRMIRERKEAEIKERGKVNYSMANIDKSKMQEYGRKAAAGAARWNAAFNKDKRDERRYSFDLQTFILQKPIGQGRKMPPEITKIGAYPVAVLPGQYTDYYRVYSSLALSSLPLNSVLAAPIKHDHLGSDGAGSDSDIDNIQQGLGTADITIKDEKGEPLPRCKVCNGTKNKNKGGKPEPLIICGSCRSASHPVCIDLTLAMVPKIESYNWQCMDCKNCVLCSDPDDEEKMIFCDMCDRGYHIYCVGLRRVPNGRWHCKECAICSSCGSKTPQGNEHVKNAEWQHEFKKDKDNKQLKYATTLCVPCDKYWKRRQFCYVCLKVYRSIPEDGMVRCNNCPKYIHREGCSTIYENERFCNNCFKMRNSTALNHSRIIAAAKKKMASGY